MTTLKNKLENGKYGIEKWIEKLDTEWEEINRKLEIEKIEKKFKVKWEEIHKIKLKNIFKDFGIWLFSLSHVEDIIQIILYLSGLAQPISITIQTLHIFGIEKMFAEAITKMGVKIVCQNH